VEGLRALDRYTFQVKLADPKPRLLYNFADGSFTGALAREVVKPTATRSANTRWAPGPSSSRPGSAARASCWRATPTTATVRYDEHPPEGDARLQAIGQGLQGPRLPLLDEVHIAIIEEPQPRWLSFLNEEQDLMDQSCREDFARGGAQQPAGAQPGQAAASGTCATRAPTWR
jgi:hypothetical protein